MRNPGYSVPCGLKCPRAALRTRRSGSATAWSTTSSGAPSAPIRVACKRRPGWGWISTWASLAQAAANARDLAGHLRMLLGARIHLVPGRGRRLAVAVQELLVRGHPRHRLVDRLAHALEQAPEVSIGNRARQRVVGPGYHALAEHAVGPGIEPEQLVLPLQRMRAIAEHADAVGEIVGHGHVAHLLPQRLVALVEVVVQDDEVP